MNNKNVKLFLRFYNQTNEKIEECIEHILSIKDFRKRVVDWEIVDGVTGSVNDVLTLSSVRPKQVNLYFKNEGDYYSVFDNEEAFRIYKKYSAGEDVETEEYVATDVLKKTQSLREQLQKAVESEDYKKAEELKNKINNDQSGI